MRLWKVATLGATALVVMGGTTAAVAGSGSDGLGTTAGQPGTFECPVTEPPAPGFVPPKPHPVNPSVAGMVWFGTAELWTALPADGAYSPRKSVWWSSAFRGGGKEPQPEIDVVWERLDLDGTSFTNGGRGTNAHTDEDGWFMIAGGDPNEPGCWRVTASYRDVTLSYVYERP